MALGPGARPLSGFDFTLWSECYPLSVLETKFSGCCSLQLRGLDEVMRMLLCDPMGAATMVACIHAKGHRFFDSDELFERHLDLAKQIDVEDCPGLQTSQGSRARVLA